MSENHAPIALFVYKRPVHTARVLEALNRCRSAAESELFVFSDGPRRIEDEGLVRETRRIIQSSQWCGKVHLVESDKNRGLAASVIRGVTELVNKYGRVIVLEDDLVVAPNFLTYMNEALDKYASETRVLQISGHMFPVELDIREDTVFLPFITSWGWATWKRAWDLFDPAAAGYEALKTDRQLRKRFDLNDSYPYTRMMFDQMEGRIDSWAIRWYWSFFRAGGIALYPKCSLVINTGMDGSGTHCGEQGTALETGFSEFGTKSEFVFPLEEICNQKVFAQLGKYFKKKPGFLRLLKNKIRKLL